MTILQRREARLRAGRTAREQVVQGACRVSGKQGPLLDSLVLGRSLGLSFYDSCPGRLDGVENGVLVAAHKVSGYVGITRLVVDTAEEEREREEKERA